MNLIKLNDLFLSWLNSGTGYSLFFWSSLVKRALVLHDKIVAPFSKSYFRIWYIYVCFSVCFLFWCLCHYWPFYVRIQKVLSETDQLWQRAFVPHIFEEKRRDLVFASPSFGPFVCPSFSPPIDVGTLWAQLVLQFYTYPFETSLVFWSWSEDMHVVWI